MAVTNAVRAIGYIDSASFRRSDYELVWGDLDDRNRQDETPPSIQSAYHVAGYLPGERSDWQPHNA